MKMKSKGEGVFNFVNVTFMIFLCLTIVLPIWNIVVLSFNDAHDAMSGSIYFWPRMFTLDNYSAVFSDTTILNAFVISVLKTIVGVVTHVTFTGIVAYAVSKKNVFGRNLFIKMGVITMFFGGGMIPTYLLMNKLNLLDSFWVYIIPALFSFYDLVIMMNFFREIPKSLEESAKIDGANEWQILSKLYVPLSMPVFATIALFNGVGQWNDYMTTKLYIVNEHLYSIQYYLYKLISSAQALSTLAANTNVNVQVQQSITTESLQMATMVVATVPIIIVYPFLQKYFVKGLTLGAVKE